MHDNTIHNEHHQHLHAGPVSTLRRRSRSHTHRPTRPPSKPRKWVLVQVWNGAVLAAFDDETSARDTMSRADDDEVVMLYVNA
jgi:uncharacterized protein (DUF2384 family)